MKNPTKKEILKARQAAYEWTLEAVYQVEKMLHECWTGTGWNRVDLAYGIMMGLQIAENRRKRERPEEIEVAPRRKARRIRR